MIETDFSTIDSGQRSFIKVKDWQYDKPYHFYLTRHEKVTKVSERTGNPYTLYYIYVLEILEDGSICGEEVLSVFASQAQAIKKAKQWQDIFVTKHQGEKGDDFVFSLGDKFISKKDQPTLPDYSPVELPKDSVTSLAKSGEEIDISDIPF